MIGRGLFLLIGFCLLGASPLAWAIPLSESVTSSGASKAPEDRLIVAGVRVGRWNLGMNLDDLMRMHGYPVRLYVMAGLPSAAEAVFDHLVFRWDGVAVMAATFVGHKRVEFLQTGFLMPGGHRYRTDRGIGFLATRAQIMKTYGRPTAEVMPHPLEMRMIYDTIGIAFSLDMAERVHTIFIFRPGTAGRFWHLI